MGASNNKFRFRDLYKFRGFKFYDSFIDKSNILVVLKRVSKTGKCPCCNRRCRHIHQRRKRRIRDLDVANSQVFIEFVSYQLNCVCGYEGYENLEFCEEYSRYTKRFEKKVSILCKVMTIKDVAKETGISWNAVKYIDKKEAINYLTDLDSINPRKIGVDEIAYQKHHKYLTVVRDAKLDKVIWVGKDRKKETLDIFFRKLGVRKSMGISIAVIDMWDPYIASIEGNAPNAQIVFDKFHVAKKVNEALDKVRKEEFAKADKEERVMMKHKRFLMLSRQKRLDDKKRETLYGLKDINQNLYAAYLLKEQIADILDENNAHMAFKRLRKWIDNIYKAGIKQYEELVVKLKRYMYGIYNYFECKLTNAASEGINNKINVIKRRAYGFRDLDYFVYKIYQLCGIKSSSK
jgi:transposase